VPKTLFGEISAHEKNQINTAKSNYFWHRPDADALSGDHAVAGEALQIPPLESPS
jgi:hypothetical protein